MKTTVPSNKSGSILVIVVVIMVSFTLMVAALLQLANFNQQETIEQLQITQAHWLAEAGLERALSWIAASKDYRENGLPDTLSESSLLSSGEGNYSVVITSGSSSSTPGFIEYTITSTGTVLTETDVVQLTMDAVSGGTDALEAPGSNAVSKISSNPDITGSIDVENILEIAKGVHPGDIVGIVDAGEVKKNPGAVTEGDLPDSEPPTIDEDAYTDFVNLLDIADNIESNSPGYIKGNAKSSEFEDQYNSDGEIFVNGEVEVDSNIPAGKTIVATKKIETSQGHTDFGDGVYLVSGDDVKFKNHIELGEQTVVFAEENIKFETQSATADGTTLIAEGDVETKNIEFRGLIYAEGEVKITAGSEISGAVVAQEGFELDSNVVITYDPSVFPNNSLIDFKNSLVIAWDEWTWQQL